MRFYIVNTSGCGYNAIKYESKLEEFKYEEVRDDKGLLMTVIELNSLEDLKKLCEAVNHELIVDFREDNVKILCKVPFIEIYDDWRE